MQCVWKLDMQNFIRSVLFTAFVLAGVLSLGTGAQAQTNQALALDPPTATAYWRQCFEDNQTPGSCRKTIDIVDVACRRDISLTGDFCTFTYPDGSRVEADPNFFAGAQFRNYDSAGNLVGRDGQGGLTGNEGEGTLEGRGDYDTSNGGTCGITNPMVCIRDLPGMLFVAIGFVFLYLSGLILFLTGTVFNWIVLRTVFQFGEYFGTSEGMLVAWGVMRDIANIGLLFGFILMGVLLILNVDGGGHGHGGGISAKRAIPRLLIFAVLLNFSLFATQFVVDVANAFGSSFSSLAGTSECEDAVTSGSGNPSGEENTLEYCATNVGISGKILQAAGISGIWSDSRGDLQVALSNLTGRPYSYAVSLIMLSIFVLVTAFVLLAGAILLVIRVVVLMFLMVTSPVGFAGMVIPGLSGIASKWWHTLISQSFFAPIYLLLIFISIKLSETLMGSEASLANAIIADRGNMVTGNVQVVMVFMIVIGLMIASLIMAQKMGAMGAGFATKMAAIPFAMAGRNTIGRASARGLKSYEAAMGRARGSSNRLVSTLAKSPLGNFADDSIGGALKGGKNLKIAGYRSFGEEEKFREERGSHLAHAAEQAEQKKALKESLNLPNTDPDKAEKIETALQKMGVTDIKDALGDNAKHLETIAQNLSPDKFAQLMKEKDLDSETKHKLDAGRYAKVQDIMSSGSFDDQKKLVGSLSNKDLEQIAQNNPELFKRITSVDVSRDDGLITKDQRDHLKKSDNLTRSQRTHVKSFSNVERVKAFIDTTATPAQRLAAKRIAGKLGADVAELDFKHLKEPEVLSALTKSSFAAIQAKNKLSDGEIGMIINNLRASGNPNISSIEEYLRKNNSAGSYWGSTIP